MLLRLVDDWKKVHTYGSAQIAAAGALLSGVATFLASNADFAQTVWSTMPEGLREMLPANWRFGITVSVWCIGVVTARYFTTKPPTGGAQ